MILVMIVSKRKSFALCFMACACSCGVVVLAEVSGVKWMIPVAVLMAKSSITTAFCLLFFTIIDYFDNHYLGFVLGINNFIGKMSSILSPIIAEINEPIPMLSCIMFCVVSFVSSLRLEQPSKKGG